MYIDVQILGRGIETALAVLEDHIFHCYRAFTSAVYIPILVSVIQAITAVIHKIRLVHSISRFCMGSIYHAWFSI